MNRTLHFPLFAFGLMLAACGGPPPAGPGAPALVAEEPAEEGEPAAAPVPPSQGQVVYQRPVERWAVAPLDKSPLYPAAVEPALARPRPRPR